MIVTDLSSSFNPQPKVKTEKKKTVKAIKGKKHRQTKEKEIPKKVKQAVWERDRHKCIFCHKQVPVECACCHFIARSHLGLGIEQNILTLCSECHRVYDNTDKRQEIMKIFRKYLKSKYQNWNEEDLIYNKWKRYGKI